jgi:hypothetical protein
MKYEKACSLTLNHCTLIVSTNMVCYELGVNFQTIHVHCLKLKPLTHIMVICVNFKEMEINMRENTSGSILSFYIRELFFYGYLHVLPWFHANPSSKALNCLSHH